MHNWSFCCGHERWIVSLKYSRVPKCAFSTPRAVYCLFKNVFYKARFIGAIDGMFATSILIGIAQSFRSALQLIDLSSLPFRYQFGTCRNWGKWYFSTFFRIKCCMELPSLPLWFKPRTCNANLRIYFWKFFSTTYIFFLVNCETPMLNTIAWMFSGLPSPSWNDYSVIWIEECWAKMSTRLDSLYILVRAVEKSYLYWNILEETKIKFIVFLASCAWFSRFTFCLEHTGSKHFFWTSTVRYSHNISVFLYLTAKVYGYSFFNYSYS